MKPVWLALPQGVNLVCMSYTQCVALVCSILLHKFSCLHFLLESSYLIHQCCSSCKNRLYDVVLPYLSLLITNASAAVNVSYVAVGQYGTLRKKL